MEGVFKAVEEEPHVTEVASPYESGGAGGDLQGRQDRLRDDPVRRPDQQLDKDEHRTDHQDRAGGPTAKASKCSSAARRSQEAEEESGDSSFAIGLLAAIIILLLAFGSVVAMGLPIITALFALGVGLSLVTLGTHVFDTANFAPVLAAMIGLGVGIDYALFIVTRFRNNLDEGLEPQRGGDPRRRHRRARRALRRDDGDHRPDGDVPAEHHLPLRRRRGRRARRSSSR